MKDIESSIKPFFWSKLNGSYSVYFTAFKLFEDLFNEFSEKGFKGGDYDWESVARVFLDDKLPALADDIEFDSEAGMFCACSTNKIALKQFAKAFQTATEDLTFYCQYYHHHNAPILASLGLHSCTLLSDDVF